MTQNVQTGVAEVGKAKLYYELAGEGQPLVLAHAGVADSRMWDEQVPAFAAHYRVLRYDMRGFGKSPPAAGPFSHHEDLSGLLEQLDIEAAHFVGCSNGGMVVTDFALTFPQKVRSLTLISAALSGFEFRGEPPQTILELMGALGVGDLTKAAEVATRIWADGPSRAPEQVDAGVRERLNAMSRVALRNELPEAERPEGLEPPAIGRLGKISAPTLIVVGDKDDLNIMAIGDVLQRGITGAKKVVVPGAAHMLNMERPEAFNKIVLDFLERV